MILYKYRPLNDHTYGILAKSRLFFPKRADLNDPFEFSVVYNARLAPVLGPLYFFLRVTHIAKGVDPADALQKLQARGIFSRKAMRRGGVLKALEQGVRSRVDQSGVLCFSAVRDSILMWSHYATEHKGLCLIFDTTKDHGVLSERIWKVQYASRFPTQNVFSLNSERKFRTLLTTKSLVWKYEEEFRFLREPGGRSFNFDPAALVGIIFGCKTPSSEKARIRALLTGRPVKLYGARMNRRKYVLDIIAEP